MSKVTVLQAENAALRAAYEQAEQLLHLQRHVLAAQAARWRQAHAEVARLDAQVAALEALKGVAGHARPPRAVPPDEQARLDRMAVARRLAKQLERSVSTSEIDAVLAAA
jgi:hypothetical protein